MRWTELKDDFQFHPYTLWPCSAGTQKTEGGDFNAKDKAPKGITQCLQSRGSAYRTFFFFAQKYKRKRALWTASQRHKTKV